MQRATSDDVPLGLKPVSREFMARELGFGGEPAGTAFVETPDGYLAIYEFRRPTICGGCVTPTGALATGWAAAALFDPETWRARRYAMCNSPADCKRRVGVEPAPGERARELRAVRLALADDGVAEVVTLVPSRPGTRECSIHVVPAAPLGGVCGTTVEVHADGSARVAFAVSIAGDHYWAYAISAEGDVETVSRPADGLPR